MHANLLRGTLNIGGRHGRQTQAAIQYTRPIAPDLDEMTGTFAAGYRSGYKQPPQNQFDDFDERITLTYPLRVSWHQSFAFTLKRF